jgi:RNA polymerase sigma-70 factor (ECF subfamily)
MKLSARSGSDRAVPRLPGELEGHFLSYVRTGDRLALDRTVETVTPELRRIARYYVRREDVTEDLVQATILTSIERADSFDPSRRLVPWLTGILLNKIAAQRRESQRRFDLENEPPPEPTPLAQLESKEIDRLVQEALEQLPPHYRDVLDLYLRHGKRGGEIATELHRPPGTIRAQIHRGLRRLRSLLPPSLALGWLFAFKRSARAEGGATPADGAARRVVESESAVGLSTAALALGLVGVLTAYGLYRLLGSDRAPAAPAVLAAGSGDDLPALADARDPGGREPTELVDRLAHASAPVPVVAALQLRTVDRVTGAVLAGVTVDAYADTVAGERVTWSATSDAEGRVSFPIARDAIELFTSTASVAGYAPLGTRWDRSSPDLGAPAPLVVPLIAKRSIGGVVVDENGLPVAGATVLLNGSLLLNGSSWTNIHHESQARTDEEGRWSIADAATAPMQMRVRVVHPDYVPTIDYVAASTPTREDLWAHESRLVLRRGEELVVDARDADGRRIAVDVTLVDAHDPPRHFSHLGNSGGEPFAFTLPEVDRFLLRLSAPGHDTKIRSIRPRRSAGRRLDVRMLATEPRRLTVLDEAGTPVRNALVRRYGQPWESAAMTDVRGEFPIAVAAGGVLWVEVRRGGVLGAITLKADLGEGVVRLPEPRSLDLTVLDASTSAPLSDYSVELQTTEGRPLAGRFVGAGEPGHLSFQSATRSLRARVARVGYETFVSGPLHPETARLPLEVALRPTPTLQLEVLGPEGEEVAFHQIAIGTSEHPAVLRNGVLFTSRRHPQKLNGRSSGSVRFNRPQEPFTLTIISRSGFAHVRDVDLDASTTVHVTPWGCLEGNAEAGTEIALAGGAEADRTGLRFEYRRAADSEGRFHFCSVPPGPVEATGSTGTAVHCTVLPGATARTEL